MALEMFQEGDLTQRRCLILLCHYAMDLESEFEPDGPDGRPDGKY